MMEGALLYRCSIFNLFNGNRMESQESDLLIASMITDRIGRHRGESYQLPVIKTKTKVEKKVTIECGEQKQQFCLFLIDEDV